MKKQELKKVSGIIADLGRLAIPERIDYLESFETLADFFHAVYGVKLDEKCAGLSIGVSLAERNRDIVKANKNGLETTRTRLIRVLTDKTFYGRDGSRIKKFESPIITEETK